MGSEVPFGVRMLCRPWAITITNQTPSWRTSRPLGIRPVSIYLSYRIYMVKPGVRRCILQSRRFAFVTGKTSRGEHAYYFRGSPRLLQILLARKSTKTGDTSRARKNRVFAAV